MRLGKDNFQVDSIGGRVFESSKNKSFLVSLSHSFRVSRYDFKWTPRGVWIQNKEYASCRIIHSRYIIRALYFIQKTQTPSKNKPSQSELDVFLPHGSIIRIVQ